MWDISGWFFAFKVSQTKPLVGATFKESMSNTLTLQVAITGLKFTKVRSIQW